tara:strand:- start:3590 stop:6823 length:3234 start_codon:yes stop_codon:yes gene_type:complete
MATLTEIESFTDYNNIDGIGQEYFFVGRDYDNDWAPMNTDILRRSCGSVWYNPWSTSTNITWEPVSDAIYEVTGEPWWQPSILGSTDVSPYYSDALSFGGAGSNYYGKLQFHPSVQAKNDSYPPFVASHQGITVYSPNPTCEIEAPAEVAPYIMPPDPSTFDCEQYDASLAAAAAYDIAYADYEAAVAAAAAAGDFRLAIDDGMFEAMEINSIDPNTEWPACLESALRNSSQEAMVDATPMEALGAYYELDDYSSISDPILDLGFGAIPFITQKDDFFGVMTPFNEEAVKIFEDSDTDGVTNLNEFNGRVSFEYGDFVERIEALWNDREEFEIPNMYLLLFSGQSETTLGLSEVLNYLEGNAGSYNTAFLDNIASGRKKYLIPASEVAQLKTIAVYKNYFALRSKAEFTTGTNTELSNAFRDSNYDGRFLRTISETSEDELEHRNIGMRFSQLALQGEDYLYKYDYLASQTKSYDVFDLIRRDAIKMADDPDGTPPEDTAFIGRPSSESISNAKSNSTGLFGGALALLASGLNLKELLNTHNRTYQDIMNGVKPYSETMVYKISQFRKDDFATTFFGAVLDMSQSLSYSMQILAKTVSPIQEVWISNSDDAGVIEYVNTQNKYDTDYVYYVSAFVLTIGSKYFYSNYKTQDTLSPDDESALMVTDMQWLQEELSHDADAGPVDPTFLDTLMDIGAGNQNLMEASMADWYIDKETVAPYDTTDKEAIGTPSYDFQTSNDSPKWQGPEDECSVTFTVTTMPTAILTEVPYFLWDGRIMDRAPTVPDVRIIPYKGVPDKIGFWFNDSAGSIDAEPIIINHEEKEIFEAMASSQERYDGLIEFGGDNPNVSYEVYRMLSKPTKYEDFSGNLVSNVSTDYDPATIQKADSASYIDDIKPNTKYYYTFRAIDIHGHFSNPTDVYEVQMVEDDGVVYPYVRMVDFDAVPEKDTSKPLKKMLHIVPKIEQAAPREVTQPALASLDADYVAPLTSAAHAHTKGISLGPKEDGVWNRVFKIRLVSRSTRRKLDINIKFGTEYVEDITSPIEEANVEYVDYTGDSRGLARAFGEAGQEAMSNIKSDGY